MKCLTNLFKKITELWKFEYTLVFGSIIVTLFYLVRLQLIGNPLTLANDNYALGYPLRILVSSSIQQGIFPLWDHWTHGGMPLNSPLMMLSFSPIVLILSIFGIYGISTYVVEIIVIHILCFIGMYWWLTFYSTKRASFVVALCFTTLGAQVLQTPINFEAVVSVALLPWIAVGMKYCMNGLKKGYWNSRSIFLDNDDIGVSRNEYYFY